MHSHVLVGERGRQISALCRTGPRFAASAAHWQRAAFRQFADNVTKQQTAGSGKAPETATHNKYWQVLLLCGSANSRCLPLFLCLYLSLLSRFDAVPPRVSRVNVWFHYIVIIQTTIIIRGHIVVIFFLVPPTALCGLNLFRVRRAYLPPASGNIFFQSTTVILTVWVFPSDVSWSMDYRALRGCYLVLTAIASNSTEFSVAITTAL